MGCISRIRNLAKGEISCGLLSQEESLSLLLTSADLEHLIDNPPAAALEAVECCGRLALALPIAGGMIRELEEVWEKGMAVRVVSVSSFAPVVSAVLIASCVDDWQSWCRC